MRRTEVFVTPERQYLARGEALRALVAAIYDTARVKPEFTTDDVFGVVRSAVAPAESLRVATANSKLIAVALRKAAAKGMCRLTEKVRPGDQKCHGRTKRVWQSNLYAAAA